MDFLREGHNAERFAALNRGERAVFVPRVFWRATTMRVLTMEHSPGHRADAQTPDPARHAQFAATLMRLFLTPQFNSRDAFRAYSTRLLKHVMLPDFGVAQIAELYRFGTAVREVAGGAPVTLQRLMGRLERGEPMFDIRHQSSGSLERHMLHASNRLAFALIIASIVIDDESDETILTGADHDEDEGEGEGDEEHSGRPGSERDILDAMISRLLLCLAFALPLFIWAHMGLPFPPSAPPFGLTLDQWIFVLAGGAVLWPGWPFFVATNALPLKRARIPGLK